MQAHFWQSRPLDTLSQQEWESLCDGCGRCCLIKLEDVDTGELHHTRVACRHLSLSTGRCSVYQERDTIQPDCVPLTPQNLSTLAWMPASCAYLRVAQGSPLPAWHPLLTGHDTEVPHVGHYAVSEADIPDTDELERFIIDDYES